MVSNCCAQSAQQSRMKTINVRQSGSSQPHLLMAHAQLAELDQLRVIGMNGHCRINRG
jgi:tRNA-dihydrouridine synthase